MKNNNLYQGDDNYAGCDTACAPLIMATLLLWDDFSVLKKKKERKYVNMVLA